MIWKFPHYKIGTPLLWDEIEAEYSWFRDMKGVVQDKIWHAEGDVYTHTKMVVENLLQLSEFKTLNEQDKHIVFTAALLHDVEKRSTTTTEIINGTERIVSPHHSRRGESTVRNILYKNIQTPFHIREHIAKLVRLHSLPIWAIERSKPAKDVIKASLSVNTRLLAMLAKADVLGRIADDKNEILLKIDLFEELCRDNDCFGNARKFDSDLARFTYLNKSESSPDYVPFDDYEFTVYVMSGIPGSGKDTYISKNLNLPVISLDSIRRENQIAPTDKKNNGKVIQIAKEKSKELLRKKVSFVFNATNTTKDMRRKWCSLFADYGAKVSIIYVEVAYKQLLKQNAGRQHKVPEAVIDKLINKLDIPEYDEAYEIIYHVDD